MDGEARITRLFEESAELKRRCAPLLAVPIAAAARLVFAALDRGAKILACGNGGSAADAQHFAAELVNRFEIERAPLPALALTTDSSALTSIGNDFSFDEVFARQILALGSPDDVLLAITTSGGSRNVVRAMNVAHERGLRVVLLSGRDGGDAAGALDAGDIEIRVPARSTARVQEVHILALHCLCDLIDRHYEQGDSRTCAQQPSA